ncbi:MAG: EF-hand domain-containing protein [Chthoniobacteraceae bacterium]
MNTTSIRAAMLVVLALAGCQTTQPDRFSQVDSNRDNKLSRDEANTYFVTEAFDSQDADRNKRLTRDEWLGIEEAGQEKLFRQRDANGDGSVSLEEALAFGSRKGHAAELIREADIDRDGHLSRAEVTAYYASKEGSVR